MGKIKVIKIENEELPVKTAEPVIEEIKAEEPEPLAIEAPEQEEEQEPPSPPVSVKEEVEEDKPKGKKDDKITCEKCGKTMLMKTFKYSHQKLCPPKDPPPSPVIEEVQPVEVKPKRKAAKPKETKPVEEVKPEPEKPAWDGTVSFSPMDAYRAARDQRIQVKQQRVKSLIAQAL